MPKRMNLKKHAPWPLCQLQGLPPRPLHHHIEHREQTQRPANLKKHKKLEQESRKIKPKGDQGLPKGLGNH